MSRAKTEWRYEKLTWPEINDAVDLGKVCIVPCGAVEQHGPHLPLDVDLICPTGVARGTAELIPDKLLVLPIVAYGYTGHVMDYFAGSTRSSRWGRRMQLVSQKPGVDRSALRPRPPAARISGSAGRLGRPGSRPVCVLAGAVLLCQSERTPDQRYP